MKPELNIIIPKLPSKDLQATRGFYVDKLNFRHIGGTYSDYLMLQRGNSEIHFFLYKDLDVFQNYGQCYIRVSGIAELYNEFKNNNVAVRKLETKPWKQKEFSIIDNDHNLLTFGEYFEED